MIVAIMQPYLFPYLGYFQLARSVDHFVFLDDVNFIKKGFINRNRIISGKSFQEFTVPVKKVSQNRFINDHYYSGDFYKFLSAVKHSYSKAPYFNEVFCLVEEWAFGFELNVAKKNSLCIIEIFKYLDMDLSFSYSSTVPRANKSGEERILELCRYYRAVEYHNAIGGKLLYSEDFFYNENINIYFVNGFFRPYNQFSNEDFISGLSIIDVLMFNSPDKIRLMLQDYSLESSL